MKEITHIQARRYLRLDLDGLLGDSQRLDLQTHLDSCPACRADSESFSTLTSRLQSEFHSRWDAHDGPSQHVTANVRSQTRRIIMSNKVNLGLKALGGVAVLVVLGFVVNFVVSQLRERSVTVNVTPIPGNFMPVVAPNAEKRLLAFTMEKNGKTDVYTVRADGSDLVNLTGESNGSNPYWSPDGKRIAFNRTIGNKSQVFVMDADGSNVVQLTDDGDFNKLAAFEEGRDPDFSAWSPDGSKLIFVKLNFQRTNDEGWMKLYVLDVETKAQTPLTPDWGLYQSPAWSPDGEQVAFSAFSRFNEQGEPTRLSVHVVSADGSNPVELTASLPDTFSIFVDWSSGGQAVVFYSYRQSDESAQVYEARLDGSLSELTQPVRANILDWWNGTILTGTPGEVTVKWLRPDGTSSSLEVCPQASDTMRGASARAKAGTLFFGVRCARGEWRLYLADEDGTTVQELVNPPLSTGDGVMADQAWSPDSNYIAFNISSSSHGAEMFIIDVAATLGDSSRGPVWFNVGEIFSSTNSLSWQPVITEETLAERPPQPYEGRVAFTSAVENGNLDIYTMRPDGSGLTNLTNDPSHDVDPYWSPDGKRIAFLSDRAGYMQVFVMNADGSDVFQVTSREADHDFQGLLGGDSNPWSPDGSTLAFLERTPDGKQIIYTMEAKGWSGIPLVYPPGNYSSLSWSPDGGHIAYIVFSEEAELQLHVTSADGDDTVILTDALPEGEALYFGKYAWTRNGRAVSFVASNLPAQGGFSIEGNAPNPYYWKVYEASLDGGTLIQHAETRSPIGGWWQGNYFVTPLLGLQSWSWVTAEGTTSVNPFRNCADPSGGGSLYQQSSNGNTFLAARCPNFDWWLYWVNPKGTMLPLSDSPLQSVQGDLYNPAWSPDDRYIAFNLVESGVTNLYVLDVTQAVSGTPTSPVKVPIGGGHLYYNVSWQPMP